MCAVCVCVCVCVYIYIYRERENVSLWNITQPYDNMNGPGGY